MTTANDKLQKIREELNNAFVERSEVIDGMLTAFLAGEHVLLLGNPGTAKSALARAFSDAVAGDDPGNYFQWLLTKFSTPEEIFGPISLKSMKEDKYLRITKFKLPEAKVAFLDECWKANSSILNSLLTALNEKLFYNGDQAAQMPLQTCIGASNEYPEDNSLDALYDRFLLRFWVDCISDKDALRNLLLSGGAKPGTTRLTNEDVNELRGQVQSVAFNGSQTDTLLNVKAAMEKEEFFTSDRTWVKIIGVLKAHAVLNGRNKVTASDYSVLANVLWEEHTARPKVLQIISKTADPYGTRAQKHLDALKIALKDLPDFSLVENNSMTKFDFIAALAKIDSKVTALADKAKKMQQDLADDGVNDHTHVVRLVEAVEKASKKLDELGKRSMNYTG
jgi:MoxR-like ATPase